MINTLQLILTIALFFIATSVLVRGVKSIRGKRGALAVKLNLDDILWLLSVCSVLVIAAFYSNSVVSMLLATGFGLYGLLLWLDAILFVQYRIEVNRQTIAWFLTGSKGLSKGLPHLFAIFKLYPCAALIPLVWLGLSSCLALVFSAPSILLNFTLCSVLVGGICVYFPRLHMLAVLVVLMLMLQIVLYPLDQMTQELQWLVAASFVGVFLAMCLLAVLRKLFHSQHEFLTAPSLLNNILADDNFVANESIKLNSEHEKFVLPALQSQQKSAFFAQCQGANVILITVESMGAYINPYSEDGAHSVIAELLAKKSWLSKQHFCLCPNTTVSTNQMYSGAYSNNPYNKHDSLFPGADPQHIKQLKQHGYKTLFVDSANTNLFDYHRLLKRIGFDRVWGTADMPAQGLQADYRLWNMVDVIAEEVSDKPFFLHVINDQTHMPYEIIDKARFNKHKGKSQKSLYLNALEEVDYILDEFLQRLAAKLDLSNTILVFTGDHGESFGEFGYSFHSNSVILPQVQVPFMLSHPNLAPRTLEHSCHFDLFPTFFDLLGLEYSHQAIGQSLGLDEREFAYFVHSATLKGNSPANFGFIADGQLQWVDRLFNQVSVMNSTQDRAYVSKKEAEYIKTMLHRMLSHRGILV